jgi:hypothetical protein
MNCCNGLMRFFHMKELLGVFPWGIHYIIKVNREGYMRRQLTLIKQDDTCMYQFLGFKNSTGYGEILVTNKNSKTTIYRGVGLTNVIRIARKKEEVK